MSRHNDSSDVMGTVMVAAIVGFVAGLLMAPKSGVETRKDVRRHAKKIEKEVRVGLDVASETAEETRKELKAVMNEATLDAKELSADAKVRARRTLTHAKTGAQNVETKARQAWGDRVRTK